jgi:hypothetical protein
VSRRQKPSPELDNIFEILPMSMRKARILRAVAWLLGFKGEHVYCITMNVNLNDYNDAKRVKDMLLENKDK